MADKIRNSEIFHFLVLFFACIAINYSLPKEISQLWFWGLLIFFIKAAQDKNHLWIVFYWLLFSSPGYLFYGNHDLPSFAVPGMGREVYYNEIFVIIAILKATQSSIKQNVFYKKYLIFIIVFAVFLILWGLLLGMSGLTLLKSIRYFIPMLLLWFLPNLIPFNSVPRAIQLVFVAVFILVAAQLFDIIFGFPVAVLLGESILYFSGREVTADYRVFDVNQGAVRTIYGAFIILQSLIVSLALLTKGKRIFSFRPGFLIFISFLTAFSIFMSATRGWVIGAAFVFLGFALISTKKFSRIAIAFIIILIGSLMIPKVHLQFEKSFERVSTLESLAKGDLSMEGTLTRITERGPRVMKKYYEQPIFGFGFSDEYYRYLDGHVGNQSLLLNGGIVGFLIYLIFILSLLNRFRRSYKYYRNSISFIFIFGLLSMVIIHSSSTMIFAYALSTTAAISISFFLLLANYFLTVPFETDKIASARALIKPDISQQISI